MNTVAAPRDRATRSADVVAMLASSGLVAWTPAVVRPVRVQVWREASELWRRVLVRVGTWLP